MKHMIRSQNVNVCQFNDNEIQARKGATDEGVVFR